MTQQLIAITFLALFGSVVALIGGVFFLYVKDLSKTLTKYSSPFAAGVLLTVALIGMIPETHHMIGESTFTIVLASFLAAYLFETLIMDLHHHHDHHCRNKKHHQAAVPLVIVGDTIHNFIDGIAIASSYLINPGLGVITTISTFLHEVPHEIGDFGILLGAGWGKGKVLGVNFISALFTLAGAAAVVMLNPSEQISGIMLAASAGLFLYLGASDFLPHANDTLSTKKAVVALLIGVFTMFFTLSLVPHTH